MTDQEILRELGRKVRALTNRVHRLERQMEIRMDIFDRIAAAISAKQSGDNAAYDAHLTALDQEYSSLQGAEAGDASNIATLNAGLQKIADAVNPAAPQTTAPAQAPSDGTTGTTAPTSDTTATTGTSDTTSQTQQPSS